jgi:hypothetical protein
MRCNAEWAGDEAPSGCLGVWGALPIDQLHVLVVVVVVIMVMIGRCLVGTAAAPLHKALTDSGLGSAVLGGGFDDDLRQVREMLWAQQQICVVLLCSAICVVIMAVVMGHHHHHHYHHHHPHHHHHHHHGRVMMYGSAGAGAVHARRSTHRPPPACEQPTFSIGLKGVAEGDEAALARVQAVVLETLEHHATHGFEVWGHAFKPRTAHAFEPHTAHACERAAHSTRLRGGVCRVRPCLGSARPAWPPRGVPAGVVISRR